MLFSIRNLIFDLGPLVLEGWAAFAARCLYAMLLIGGGWGLRRLLRLRVLPRLADCSRRFAVAPILLRSFALPLERIALFSGLYLGLVSLPWAVAGIPKALLTFYQIAVTFFIAEGFYNAPELAELLLASSAEEIRSNKTLVTVLSKGYRILVVVLAGATIAQESGLPLGSIVAGAGLLGLTISLAAQDTASNLFSGLVILLDRPFALGDWITVGDVEGEVVDINFRSTKIRAIDNTLYILTNSHVSNATINNGSQRTMRLYRFTLGVTYDTTRAQLEQLMADLTAYLKASEYTYEDTVYVKLTEFGASSINLSVSAYLRTPDKMRFLEMQNELNLDLLDLMKQNGVEFAFPSSTVYLAQNN